MGFDVNVKNSVVSFEKTPVDRKNFSKNVVNQSNQKSYDAGVNDALGNYGKAALDIQKNIRIKETLVRDLLLKDETAINSIVKNRDKDFNDSEIAALQDFLDACLDSKCPISESDAAKIINAAGNEITFARKIGIATDIINRFPEGFVQTDNLVQAVKEMEGNTLGLLSSKAQYAKYGKPGFPQDLVVDGLHYVKSGEGVADWQTM